MKETIFKKEVKVYRTEKMFNKTELNSGMSGNSFSKKHPYFQIETIFTDEQSFVENFANPLCNVFLDYRMVVIEKDADKISIKLFQGYKTRRAGVVWFKKSKNCDFISVNLKTGNVYNGYIQNYHLKKKVIKKISCNFFISQVVENFQIKLKNSLTPNPDFYLQPLEDFINLIDVRNDFKLSLGQRLLKFHLDKKGVKYPNNFYLFNDYTFGKEYRKILKKNDNKLIDSVMELLKIKGNKLKKTLHQTTQKINLNNYLTVKSLFGEDWLNQDENIIYLLINSQNSIMSGDLYNTYFYLNATKKEKRNAFDLLKDSLINFSTDVYSLSDHFRFWVELKRYGDTEIVWKSDGKNEKFFREEHLDWADKLEHYKRGHYERIYPDIFNETIKTIEYEGVKYFPVVLMNSTDYNNESAMQSNCVKGYIGRCSSLIISLRKGNEDSEDRLTVEYSISKLPDVKWVVIKRIQTRARYNSEPSSEWNQPLHSLDCMMNEIALSPKFEPHKLIKICSNGVQMESDSHFDEKGYLKWSYTPIDQYGFEPYFI
jgi:hypothetical protein